MIYDYFLKFLIFLFLSLYIFRFNNIAIGASKCEEIRKISTTSKVVTLTFDDGPNPDITNKILEILSKNNIKATFFVVGKKALQYPDILNNIHSQGHTIGNHSFSHMALDNKDELTIIKEIILTNLIIYF
ncbi:MAG: polysaccharide deacetylase family protein [Minisyncoccia bacterium]